jgi:hypothetical protein
MNWVEVSLQSLDSWQIWVRIILIGAMTSTFWFLLFHSPGGAASLDLSENKLTGTIPIEIVLLTNVGTYYPDWCNDVRTLILIIPFTWWRSFSTSLGQYIFWKYPFSYWTLDKIEWVLSWLAKWLAYFDSNYFYSPGGAANLDLSINALTRTIPSELGRLAKLGTYYRDFGATTFIFWS